MNGDRAEGSNIVADDYCLQYGESTQVVSRECCGHETIWPNVEGAPAE